MPVVFIYLKVGHLDGEPVLSSGAAAEVDHHSGVIGLRPTIVRSVPHIAVILVAIEHR